MLEIAAVAGEIDLLCRRVRLLPVESGGLWLLFLRRAETAGADPETETEHSGALARSFFPER